MTTAAEILGEAVMMHVARRIATLAFNGACAEAERQFRAHCAAMSPDEIEIFSRAVATFAIDIQPDAR